MLLRQSLYMESTSLQRQYPVPVDVGLSLMPSQICDFQLDPGYIQDAATPSALSAMQHHFD